jgi:hypothetical protein
MAMKNKIKLDDVLFQDEEKFPELRKSSSGKCFIGLDFDGTLFGPADNYPEVGEPVEKVIKKALECQEKGAKLILWTCRSGLDLRVALASSTAYGIKFDAINDNPWFMTGSRKIYCTLYVDDRAPGSIQYFLEKFKVEEYL